MIPEAETLPDLLRDDLDVVFIGINPSLYSVARGHYFARAANRFWPALSRSTLSHAARAALAVDPLRPEDDRALLDHGIGFTDVVKRPTARASDLALGEYAAGSRELAAKLQRYYPRIACFQGMMGFRPFAAAIAPLAPKAELGEQSFTIGRTRIFVIPNPSPANAHATPAAQTAWYDRLAAQSV